MSPTCLAFTTAMLILIFVFIVPNACYAQNQYRKGVIITLKGDTVEGYIDDRLAIDPLFEIKFKRPLDEKAESFNPNNIKGYILSDGRSFESHYVYTVSPGFRENGLLYVDTSRTTLKFLTVSLKGTWLSLYSFYPENSHYTRGPVFYLEDSAKPEVLTPLLCWGIWNPDKTIDWAHITGFKGPFTDWESIFFEGYKRTLRKYFSPYKMHLQNMDILYHASYTTGDLKKILEFLNYSKSRSFSPMIQVLNQ